MISRRNFLKKSSNTGTAIAATSDGFGTMLSQSVDQYAERLQTLGFGRIEGSKRCHPRHRSCFVLGQRPVDNTKRPTAHSTDRIARDP
ncbi:MAG: twin-arginine translocation signal domain-containing protein [Verrucomicrobia bacterium]|nr:twin-arginine translocation signal domain-containing protein [Verrucomicrobiota bacterium]